MMPLPSDDPRLLRALETLSQEGEEEHSGSGSNPDWTALHWFAAKKEGDPIRAQARCLLGEDINAVSAQGDTPLHVAVWQKNASQVGFLLAMGALASLANKKDDLPFHLALRKRELALAERLLPEAKLSEAQAIRALKQWGEGLAASTPAASPVWKWAVALPRGLWEQSGVEARLPEPLRIALRAGVLERALPQTPSVRAAKPRF